LDGPLVKSPSLFQIWRFGRLYIHIAGCANAPLILAINCSIVNRFEMKFTPAFSTLLLTTALRVNPVVNTRRPASRNHGQDASRQPL
jgi:hypothetical protein